MDLLSEYNVSAIFNVYDIFPFDACLNLRMNSFKERGNDVIQSSQSIKDPLLILEFSHLELIGFIVPEYTIFYFFFIREWDKVFFPRQSIYIFRIAFPTLLLLQKSSSLTLTTTLARIKIPRLVLPLSRPFWTLISCKLNLNWIHPSRLNKSLHYFLGLLSSCSRWSNILLGRPFYRH